MTEKNGKRRLNKDTLNLVIAVSAVLISAASFYAAYVQSEAAKKQVQAETWPYLQIQSSNYNVDLSRKELNFSVVNSGVGPARLKTLNYYYKGQKANDFGILYDLCCLTDAERKEEVRRGIGNAITGTRPPSVLTPGNDLLFFSSVETGENADKWSRVDAARWHITADACYCSLLDECFKTDFINDPVPVKTCTPERAD